MQKTLADKFFRGTEILMGIFLGCMVVLVFLNVILRYCFNTGLTWSEEAASLLFVFSIYIGAVGAARDNQHIIVRAALDRFPPHLKKWTYVAGQALSILMLLLLAYGSVELAKLAVHSRMSATNFPRWLYYGIGLLMGGGMSIVSLLNIYKAVIKKVPIEKLMEIHGNAEDMEKMN